MHCYNFDIIELKNEPYYVTDRLTTIFQSITGPDSGIFKLNAATRPSATSMIGKKISVYDPATDILLHTWTIVDAIDPDPTDYSLVELTLVNDDRSPADLSSAINNYQITTSSVVTTSLILTYSKLVSVYDTVNSNIVNFYWTQGRDYTMAVGASDGSVVAYRPEIVVSLPIGSNVTDICPVFDPDTNRFVFAYIDFLTKEPMIAIGEYDNTLNTLTIGTPISLHSKITRSISAIYDEQNDKVIIAFGDMSGRAYVTSGFVTVPGNTFTIEQKEELEVINTTAFTASRTADIITATVGTFTIADVNNYFIFADGTLVFITAFISGTQVSTLGSSNIASQGGVIRPYSISHDTIAISRGSNFIPVDNNYYAISYPVSSSIGVLIRTTIAKCTGLAITFPSNITTSSLGSNTPTDLLQIFDSVDNRFILQYYSSNGTTASGNAIVGATDGSGNVSIGTLNTYSPTLINTLVHPVMNYDTSSGKIILSYAEYENPVNRSYSTIGTINDMDITFNAPIELGNNTTTVTSLGAVFDPVENRIISTLVTEICNLT